MRSDVLKTWVGTLQSNRIAKMQIIRNNENRRVLLKKKVGIEAVRFCQDELEFIVMRWCPRLEEGVDGRKFSQDQAIRCSCGGCAKRCMLHKNVPFLQIRTRVDCTA